MTGIDTIQVVIPALMTSCRCFSSHNPEFRSLIARNNQTHFLNALRLITVPGPKAAVADTSGSELPSTRPEISPDTLDWLYELDQHHPPAKDRSGKPAIDQALATYGL